MAETANELGPEATAAVATTIAAALRAAADSQAVAAVAEATAAVADHDSVGGGGCYWSLGGSVRYRELKGRSCDQNGQRWVSRYD